MPGPNLEAESFRPPQSMESTRRKQLLSETDLVSSLSKSLRELTDDIAHGTSDRLKEYLDFASRFHTYSRANQWLILSQKPHATRVTSYRKWQEEGYQVAKGTTGIRILAPSTRKIKPKQEHDGSEDTDENDSSKTIVRFVAVSVFDVSQLTPEKRPPEFFVPLAGDADGLYHRLVQAATADGFTVEQEDHTFAAEGYSQGQRIVTRSDLASVNRFLTAVHEYAHGLLHQGVHQVGERLNDRRGRLTTQVKECHAEAISYVVARHFGIDNPFSADYLLQWGNTPETLKAELDVVLAAAHHIIVLLEGGDPASAEPEAAVSP